ncbi:MAG: AbiV family abortive infection protein [Paenisporosarcina sp.]
MSINSFNEIQSAYSKIFFNASELLEEADILFKNQRYARAYLLAHIASEELARCIMLSSAIMKYKIRALDVKKLNRRQTSHLSKIQIAYNFINLLKNYNSPLNIENILEVSMKVVDINNFPGEKETQRLNDMKNAAFYVDQYKNGTFAPKERIKKSDAYDLLVAVNLFRELIEFNKWHEENKLIELVRKMDPNIILNLKEILFKDDKIY